MSRQGIRMVSVGSRGNSGTYLSDVDTASAACMGIQMEGAYPTRSSPTLLYFDT